MPMKLIRKKAIVSCINSVSQFVLECRWEYLENLVEAASRGRWLDQLKIRTSISQPFSSEDPL